MEPERRGQRYFLRPVVCIGVALGILLAVPPHYTLAKPRPNIIVILVDTLRADYLAPYGFQGNISPSISALASESIVFSHCVSQAPWTKPAVASLFTSMHPLTHRVTDHNGVYWRTVAGNLKTRSLPEQAETLAESLQTAGYETAAWVGNGWITQPLGFAQGFEKFNAPAGEERISEAEQIWNPAWAWLKNRRDDRPFFLYLHFMDTHGPWHWDEREWTMVRQSPSLGVDRLLSSSEILGLGYLKSLIQDPADEQHLVTWRAIYGSGVRVFDQRLGVFLDKLKAGGFLENTVLVFTADHGEELLEHGWWGHGYSLHSDQLRVPLIVRMPDGRGGGGRVDRIVSLIDVMPTLLTAARARPRPEGMQGQDLWRLLRGKDNQPLSKYAFAGAVKTNSKTVSIEDDQYKLIWDYPDGPVHLFDVRADFLEQHDEVYDKPAVATSMKNQLREEMEWLEAAGTLLETEEALSEEEIERLRSLGYIH